MLLLVLEEKEELSVCLSTVRHHHRRNQRILWLTHRQTDKLQDKHISVLDYVTG